MDIIWYIFDMIGTIAFAVSGALVGGVARKMDIFGMSVLALATAIGGRYCSRCIARLFSAELAAEYRVCNGGHRGDDYRIYHLQQPISTAGDGGLAVGPAICLPMRWGLASFTVTGASAGYTLYPDLPIFIVLLGTITAVGGWHYSGHAGAAHSVRSERRCIRLAQHHRRHRLLRYGPVRLDRTGRVWSFQYRSHYTPVGHQISVEFAKGSVSAIIVVIRIS